MVLSNTPIKSPDSRSLFDPRLQPGAPAEKHQTRPSSLPEWLYGLPAQLQFSGKWDEYLRSILAQLRTQHGRRIGGYVAGALLAVACFGAVFLQYEVGKYDSLVEDRLRVTPSTQHRW